MGVETKERINPMTDIKTDRKIPEHVAENRRYWNAMADEWVASGERGWETDTPSWGCWHIPETELKLLPDDMSGMRAIELGCGTGYVACWLSRRGAEVVGIDKSEKQLATAKRLSAEHDLPITLEIGPSICLSAQRLSMGFMLNP